MPRYVKGLYDNTGVTISGIGNLSASSAALYISPTLTNITGNNVDYFFTYLAAPTLLGTVTGTSSASTLYIAGAPTGGTGGSRYALNVAGNSYFDGNLTVTGTINGGSGGSGSVSITTTGSATPSAACLYISPATTAISGSNNYYFAYLANPPISGSTTGTLSTLYIQGSPTSSNNIYQPTGTSYSLNINSGNSYFGGEIASYSGTFNKYVKTNYIGFNNTMAVNYIKMQYIDINPEMDSIYIYGITSSSDGSKLAICGEWQSSTVDLTRFIATSTNYGLTWTYHLVSIDYFGGIASSSDNTIIAVCSQANPSQFSISINSGLTWSGYNTPNGTYTSIACSTDATYIVMCGRNTIDLSIDYGHTWTTKIQINNKWWNCIACSSDCKIIAVTSGGYYGINIQGEDTGSYILMSVDRGTTWTNRLTDAGRLWTSITCNADGTKLAACSKNGSIWISTDTGTTWTERMNDKGRNWTSIESDSTFTNLIATTFMSEIYISTDSGITWIMQPINNSNPYIVNISPNGNRIAIGGVATKGGLYVGDFKNNYNTILTLGNVSDTLNASTQNLTFVNAVTIPQNIINTSTVVSVTNSASLYIEGLQTAGINTTITNLYALYVAGGTSYFGGLLSGTTGLFSGTVTINDTTQSVDKDTGCVVLQGGIGIEKNANIGGTLGVIGASTMAGISASGIIATSNTTTATSTTTGALKSAGGLGVVENAYIGGTLNVTGASNVAAISASGIIATSNTTTATSTTTGALKSAGGLGVVENAYIGGTLNVTGASTVAAVSASGIIATSNTTTATSTITGALKSAGGLGVVENAYIGGTLNVTGNSNLNSSVDILGIGSTTAASASLYIAPTSTTLAGNNVNYFFTYFTAPTLTSTATGTSTASTLYIAGAPTGGTIATRYAVNVAAGNCYFAGDITVGGTIIGVGLTPSRYSSGPVQLDTKSNNYIIATSNSFTIILPQLTGDSNTGLRYYITNIGTGTITLSVYGGSSDTFDGSTISSLTLYQYDRVQVVAYYLAAGSIWQTY